MVHKIFEIFDSDLFDQLWITNVVNWFEEFEEAEESGFE